MTSTEDDLLFALLQNVTGLTNPSYNMGYPSTTEDLIAAINVAISGGALRGTPYYFDATEGQINFGISGITIKSTDLIFRAGKKLDYTKDYNIVAGFVQLIVEATELEPITIIVYTL